MNSSLPSRSHCPSLAQIEKLVEFLEANPDVAKGFGKQPSVRARCWLKWKQWTLKLNSMGGGTVKDSKKWIKYWSDKRQGVKKKAIARNEALRSGEGLEEAPELSEVEERILKLMMPTQNCKSIKAEGISNVSEPNPLRLPQDDDQLQEMTSIDVNNSSEDKDWWSQGRLNNSQLRSRLLRSVKTPPRSNSPAPATGTRCRPAFATTARRFWRASNLQRTSLPSQRQSQFASVAAKLVRLEEQRLELDRQLVEALKQSFERERLTAQANIALGEGLKALAAAISNNNRVG